MLIDNWLLSKGIGFVGECSSRPCPRLSERSWPYLFIRSSQVPINPPVRGVPLPPAAEFSRSLFCLLTGFIAQ